MKFTRAEQEMRIAVNEAIRCRRPIHAIVDESRETQPTSTTNVTVKVKRLTRREIDRALEGDFSNFESTTANNSAENVTSQRNNSSKYNLRKRE